jgi:hypothetical protein
MSLGFGCKNPYAINLEKRQALKIAIRATGTAPALR